MSRDTLLLVDDMEVNRGILRALFEDEYNLLEAENGEQAIMLIKQYRHTLAAVLLDLLMPVKDGYQVMEEMAQNGLMSSIPVIVITSENAMENEVRAFDLGAADIIIKPFEPYVARRRVQNAVELNRHKMHLEEMVEEQATKLRESRDVIMDTLSSIIEHRSVETGQHVLRIRMFTKVLLEDVMRCCPEYELNERAIGIIAEAAALHDIGKISIPDTILNKPGRLTAEEFEVMKTHSVKGCEILSGLDRMGDEEYLMYAYNICRYHHERWDGSGYPDHLCGDNIPIYAQAVGVADAYDALTTDRVYKKAIPPQRALTMILNGDCGAFSPKLLECLKNIREQFLELTQEYADGHSPKSDGVKPMAARNYQHAHSENTPVLGQMKYFTMLRYLGSTVLEVDMDSGIYHLVYQQNEDFLDLKSGATFVDSLNAFAEHAVHPDDRPLMREVINNYIQDFFRRGFMQRSRTYRVLHRATGEYIWYNATILRVDIDNPKHHKALIIWKEVEFPKDLSVPTPETSDTPVIENLMVGFLRCLNDQLFTITYVNDGFSTLLGYSRQEIEETFHNHYLEMIHPDDRLSLYRDFLKKLSANAVQEMEYRVITKQKQSIWVLDKSERITGADGREYLNCVLTDISQVKQAQEELRLSMERYRIIQDQTNDIIFEADLVKGMLSYSSNWEKKFGYKPMATEIRTQLRTTSHIFPEDIPPFLHLVDGTLGGLPYGEVEVRIANADGKYLWCRVRSTTLFDSNGKAVKAVGVIVDIDHEKRRTQELINRAEQDALTKLYAKSTARDFIERKLEDRTPEEKFAMMIVDLDNFKQLNDLRGHMFGDAVLAEAASRLKMLFGNIDILARFGGDEFLVFLPYTSDESFLVRKAEKILETFHDIFSKRLRGCPLTCSIGVSRCPADGATFQSLFQKCDQALYEAKMKGKDMVAFYDHATMSKIFGLNAEQVFAVGTRIDSDDASDYSVDSIVPEAFRLLYESGDLETAVNAILEMTGRKYNVSRAYIFENSPDGTYCTNTFEWCNQGIMPAISSLQNMPYTELGPDYRENFNENGIFYCQDISTLPKEQYDILVSQGIRSLLQCVVKDQGKFAGFVGFDDCVDMRMWTQNQIDALTFISELLSTFLLKKRAQDRALEAAQSLRMVLDNQNSWIYVIEPGTFALLFINAKTHSIAPDARLGTPCYEAFFRRDSPCEICPIKGSGRPQNVVLEVYNPVLKVWSLADATLIRWNHQDAYMLACHDVTRYKASREAETTIT